MSVVREVETIYDGMNEVELPRFDLADDGSITMKMRLRCGYAIVAPIKMGGDSPSGLEVIRQDGIPTLFALVLAVSPYHVPPGGDQSINDDLPQPGNVVVKPLYAAEPILAPSLGQGDELETLAPMERSARGMGMLNLKEVQAILSL
jgi:hypothetical protein